jgi:hypothetical protein
MPAPDGFAAQISFIFIRRVRIRSSPKPPSHVFERTPAAEKSLFFAPPAFPGFDGSGRALLPGEDTAQKLPDTGGLNGARRK